MLHIGDIESISYGTSATPTQIYAYFRMGLATGVVEPQAVIAWADGELLRNPAAGHETLDLALAGRLPLSQLMYLLSSFVIFPDYGLPLDLLLAHAGLLLERDPSRAPWLIQNLNLLSAEVKLSKAVKERLGELDACRVLGLLSPDELHARLSAFLGEYAEFRPLVLQIHN